MITREHVQIWMEQLKLAWESENVEAAMQLFRNTTHYYERPFKPGTTREEIETYWKDIVNLYDIRLDYRVGAIEDNAACVIWDNWFRTIQGGEETHLNGVFIIEFDGEGQCAIFRQWWFKE